MTSRDTQRWVIPKGWPIDGLDDWDAAAKEAEEEAGMRGEVGVHPLGSYAYFKRLEARFRLLDVVVYPLWVREQASDWKEKGQRDYLWLDAQKAAVLVDEPGLKALLRSLALTPPLSRLAS